MKLQDPQPNQENSEFFYGNIHKKKQGQNISQTRRPLESIISKQEPSVPHNMSLAQSIEGTKKKA